MGKGTHMNIATLFSASLSSTVLSARSWKDGVYSAKIDNLYISESFSMYLAFSRSWGPFMSRTERTDFFVFYGVGR